MTDELHDMVWLAQLLGKSTATLDRWRREGTGPPYVRIGQGVRYRDSDVRAWLASQTTPTRHGDGAA